MTINAGPGIRIGVGSGAVVYLTQWLVASLLEIDIDFRFQSAVAFLSAVIIGFIVSLLKLSK